MFLMSEVPLYALARRWCRLRRSHREDQVMDKNSRALTPNSVELTARPRPGPHPHALFGRSRARLVRTCANQTVSSNSDLHVGVDQSAFIGAPHKSS